MIKWIRDVARRVVMWALHADVKGSFVLNPGEVLVVKMNAPVEVDVLEGYHLAFRKLGVRAILVPDNVDITKVDLRYARRNRLWGQKQGSAPSE